VEEYTLLKPGSCGNSLGKLKFSPSLNAVWSALVGGAVNRSERANTLHCVPSEGVGGEAHPRVWMQHGGARVCSRGSVALCGWELDQFQQSVHGPRHDEPGWRPTPSTGDRNMAEAPLLMIEAAWSTSASLTEPRSIPRGNHQRH